MLIKNDELGIPYSSPINRAVIRSAMKLLGINELNQFYGEIKQFQGAEFANAALDNLQVKVKISNSSTRNLSQEGALIVVANYPHGALDGLILIQELTKIRSDVKILGNYLLSKIEQLAPYFITTDLSSPNSEVNRIGIRKAHQHISDGGVLVLFPGGEVATWQSGFSNVADPQWQSSVIKLIRRLNVNVVPLYISGQNSWKYHLLGTMSPVLRTIRHPRELLNKRDREVVLIAGSPISSETISGFESQTLFSHFLRANVYALARKSKLEIFGRKSTNRLEPAICTAIQDELSRVDIFKSSGDFDLFISHQGQMPRLDAFLKVITDDQIPKNSHYKTPQTGYWVTVWNRLTSEVESAIRLDHCADLIEKGSTDSMFSHTYFEYRPRFIPDLEKSIEFSRLYMWPESQDKELAFNLLMDGMKQVLLENPLSRHLIGAFDIAGRRSDTTKWMIVSFVKHHYWDAERAKMVISRQGMLSLNQVGLDKNLLKGVENIDLLQKIVRDIEPSELGFPIFLRLFLTSGGTVVAFNKAQALLILDAENVSRGTIKSVKSI